MPATVQHVLSATTPDDPTYEIRPSHWNDTHAVSLSVSASEVKVTPLGAPTFDQLQEIHDLTRSAGHLDGGEITDATGGNIAVAAGQGFIRALNDDTSTLFTFDWSAPANIAIPDNSIRYVRVNYNAGSPIVTVSATEDYDYRTAFPLGFVVREGGVFYINNTPHSSGRFAGRLARRNAEVDGRSRANALGGLFISEPAAKNLAVTAGSTWFRGIRDSFPAFDSSGASRFDRYYRDSLGGWTREATFAVVPDGLWDDNSGGPLPTIGNNNYVNYWWYLGPSDGIVMVYGRGDHNSLSLAQAENPPGDLPLRLQVGALLLGRFIMRRTPGPTFTVTNIESAFTSQFIPTPVSDHGALAGLADDDHPQYHQTSLGVIRGIKGSGASVHTSGTVEFSNSNGLTFGLNAGTMTASHNGLTTAALSNHSHGDPQLNLTNLSGTTASNSGGFTLSLSAGAGGAGDGGNTIAAGTRTATSAGSVLFSNENGISFGLDAPSGTRLTASHNALTSQSTDYNFVSLGANSAGTNTFAATNNRTIHLAGGNNITLSGNGSTVTISGANIPAQTNQTVGKYALQNTTGQSSSSTWDARSLSFAGLGIVSVGNSAGSGLVISATQSNQAFSADASSTFQTLSFQGTNNFSFSNNAGAIRASHNLAGTSTGFTGVNISGSMTNNSSGLALSFSVAPGGAGGIGGIAVNASTTYTSGTVVFSAGPNITLNTNAQTISISAPNPGGGADPTISYFNNMGAAGSVSYQTIATTNRQVIFIPLTPIADVFEGNMTAATMGVAMRIGTTQAGTQGTMFFKLGIYTRDVSTLRLLNSVPASYSYPAGVGSNLLSGDRWLTVNSTEWSSSPVFTRGRYWLGYMMDSSGQTQGQLLVGQSFLATTGRFGSINVLQAATNSSLLHYPFMGRFLATTAALPVAVTRGSVSNGVGGNFIPQIYMVNSNGMISF